MLKTNNELIKNVRRSRAFKSFHHELTQADAKLHNQLNTNLMIKVHFPKHFLITRSPPNNINE